MKMMRVSAYPGPCEPPLTVVVGSPPEGQSPTLEDIHKSVPPGLFAICDTFDAPDGNDTATISLLAMHRLEERVEMESQMAIGYYWNAEMLAITSTVLANPAPAPYGVEECKEVLTQLANHPDYHGQIVMVTSQELRTVSMYKGVIVVDDEVDDEGE